MEIILKTNGIEIAGQELHFSENRDVSRAKLIGLVSAISGASIVLQPAKFMGVEFVPSLIFRDGRLFEAILMPTYRDLRQNISEREISPYMKEFNAISDKLNELYGKPEPEVFNGGKENTVKAYCYNADSVSVITERLVDSEDYCVVICGTEND